MSSSVTPNGVCKENGCSTGSDGSAGGRTNNLPICPIPSSTGLIYTTLAGGGLFVVDGTTTPMTIKGEYGQNVVFGAGCGGIETAGDKIYTNTGNYITGITGIISRNKILTVFAISFPFRCFCQRSWS